jgi:hypothetical protein
VVSNTCGNLEQITIVLFLSSEKTPLQEEKQALMVSYQLIRSKTEL